MSDTPRVPAALAYIPVIGWVYVLLTQRGNAFAYFHLRQSIGLALFLIGVLVGWAIAAFVLSWLPLFAALGAAFFTFVIVAIIYGVVALVMGFLNALNNRTTTLPAFGRWADRLPIR